MRIKKVLFVSDVLMDNPTSGSEQVLYNQSLSLKQMGYKVYAITRSSTSRTCIKNISDGIQDFCYHADPQLSLSFAYRVIRKPALIFDQLNLKENLVGVIAHQPFTCFSLLVRQKINNIPIVYVFHSPSHEEYLISRRSTNIFKLKFGALARHAIEGYCLKRSQRVMVLSRFMKDKVISLYNLKSSRIIVNPGAVDLYRFIPMTNRHHKKEEIGFKGGCVHLLSVRNLEPRMGLDNLIKAIYILKNRGVSCHLIIGGSGPEKKKLQTLISKRNLNDSVTMVGFIPGEHLVDYYNAADFFVLPTRVLEGFGLVTPESMACGTPVIGTPVGGTYEILSGFNEDFLCKNNRPDAIADGIQTATVKYFKDKSKYHMLRDSCREYVAKRYTWEQHGMKLQNLIETFTIP